MKLLFCVSAIFVFTFDGCKGSSQPTENDSSSNVSIMNVVYRADQQFNLELDLNSCAGFSWEYVVSSPTKIRLDSVSYRPKVPSPDGRLVVGGLTVETFYFHTMMSGRCVVQFSESRVWEKNIPPVHVVQLNVTIN
jgi:predicted secreted protein